MSTLNNNNIREDAIFRNKVKSVLARNTAVGSMVTALLDFRLRDEEARQEGQPGLSYDQFLDYLKRRGVQLTEFEARYLCRSFDDDGKGFISANTFSRHLTGLSHRRIKAVRQAWDSLEKDAEGRVPRTTLMASHVLSENDGGSPGLDSSFQSAARTQLKSSLKEKSTRGGSNSAEEDENSVGKDEFIAFYAGVSRRVLSDEAFVTVVLREWAADSATAPRLAETERNWGEEGDPLAITEPKYVKDALKMELGISSKEYNYSHMERIHPYVEPLPPLSRPYIMATTVQKTYTPPGQTERDFADPLVTRRGQLI